MATPEENKEIYRRYVEEIWNQGRVDAADRYIAPHATAPSAPQLPPGPDGQRIVVELFLAAFPDFHMTIEDIIAEGDVVAARFVETGTHRGAFLGIPATNRQVRFTEMAMVRFVDGLIVESRWETDMVSLYQQLGAVPPVSNAATPAAATAPTTAPQEASAMASDIIEQNRQIGQRFVDFLTRGGDPTTLFTPDFLYYDAQGGSHDLGGAMQLMQPILVAIPDRRIEVEEEIITETRVVLRWRRSGTFRQDAWGVHATGNQFSDVGVTILGIGANNMISQIWEFVDFLNFFTQIGAIREYVANMGPPAPSQGAA